MRLPPPPFDFLSALQALGGGAEALRADAESADCAGPLADPDGPARDRARADLLEAVRRYLYSAWLGERPSERRARLRGGSTPQGTPPTI